MKKAVLCLFYFLYFLCFSLPGYSNPQITQDTTRIIQLNSLIKELYKKGDYDSALYYANNAVGICETVLSKTTRNKVRQRIKKLEAAIYNSIGIIYYYKGDYTEAGKNYTIALQIREETGDITGAADSYINIGYIYYEQGRYPDALTNFRKSLAIFRSVRNIHGEADAYLIIGYIYYNQGNYPEALENYILSLKKYTETGYKIGIADAYNNIGILYEDLQNFDESLKNHFESLKIKKEIGDSAGIARSYNNIGLNNFEQYKKIKIEIGDNAGIARFYHIIGIHYLSQIKRGEALKNFSEALKLFISVGNDEGTAAAYNNIGLVYFDQSNYSAALENYFASLKIKEAAGDKAGIASTYGNIGDVLVNQKQYKRAKEYILKTIKLAGEVGLKDDLKTAYKGLSEIETAEGNYKEALKNYKLFVLYRDSIDNEESRKRTLQAQMTYEFEKKEAVAKALHKKELEKQKILSEEKSRKQKTVILFVVFGFLAVTFFAVMILRSLRITRKQKKIIESQKNEVDEINVQLNQRNEEILTQRDEILAQRDEITAQHELVSNQKEHIEKIHKEVSDSINYATRLQYAVLPDIATLQNTVSDCMVIYMPKDKVSGDFYWWAVIEKHLVIAVADCTGHGVPGAFMSMLGISFLREIVLKEYMTNPAIILKRLRKEIIKALKQSSENNSGLSPSVKDIPSQISSASAVNISAKTDVKDGMDMSLISINTETLEAQFAGAYNPAYIIKGKELTEIKGDKMPVAIHERMSPFKNNEFVLDKGDIIYLSTDGYADQFGGPNDRKFMSKRLKETLLSISELNLYEQSDELQKIIKNWMGKHGQIDDITLLGIKI